MLALFARRLGSRDKKKRKAPKKNAYGLTREQLKEEQKKTRNTHLKGAAIGLTAATPLAYALDKRYYQPKLQDSKDLYTRALNLDTKTYNTPEVLKNREVWLKKSKEAYKSHQRSRAMAHSSLLGMGLLGGVVAGNILLSKRRAKKAKNYRRNVLGIKKGYRVNTKEKYNFWHNV